MQNIATKDLATEKIQQFLFDVERLGQGQLNKFVEQRLLEPRKSLQHVKLNAPLPRNKFPTFSSLYSVEKQSKGKETTIKADRNILQRLITAYKAGRPVDLDKILQHELMPVPVSLAAMNGTLHAGSKSVLADVLTQDIVTPPDVTLSGTKTLVIDGQALVMALGKPQSATTFGGFADAFVKSVCRMGADYNRIDVTFDRYQEHSIKAGTRQKRTQTSRPIRRVIESRAVPLPSNWSNFMSLGANKEDLATFLSEQLLIQAPANKILVVAGGFEEITSARSSVPELDTSLLEACHEEADTRLVLHCIHTNADSVVVSVRDTDVLALLVAHFDKMPCTKLWMKAGTFKKPKYIPIHEIHQRLPKNQVETLLAFHAITGCDSVSYFVGHGKKTAWKVFQSYHQLLGQLGIGELTDETAKSAEKFICSLYKSPGVDKCDKARVMLFCKGQSQETLPPTTDAVQLHIKRAHYQTMVWRQANQPTPQLPNVTDMGWTFVSGQLVPKLMTLSPIPDVCTEIVSCGCTKGCLTQSCSCRKIKLPCTGACKCIDGQVECRNIID